MYCCSLARKILSIILLTCEMIAILGELEQSLALPFFVIGMKTDLFQSCDFMLQIIIYFYVTNSIFFILQIMFVLFVFTKPFILVFD